MKQFFSDGVAATPGRSFPPAPASDAPPDTPLAPEVPREAGVRRSARVAIYDDAAAAPRVVEVEAETVDSFIENTVAASYEAARDAGGDVPYTVVREIVENLIHADFSEPVISVLDDGRTLRFADQGPGISDKARAALPGFTTASSSMKRYIRGVGSGLPIVQEYLSHRGGSLEIDDNLGRGTVVTLRTHRPQPPTAGEPLPVPLAAPDSEFPRLDLSPAADTPRLSTRQKRVLSLILEVGAAGPTLVSHELSVGLSTAHRDLAHLESLGLISSDDSGKRVLTPAGSECLDGLSG